MKKWILVASVACLSFGSIGFAESPAPGGSIGITEARDAAKVKVQSIIDQGLAFLRSKQNENGTWQGEEDPPAITALVLRAFVHEKNYNSKTDFIAKGFEALLKDQRMDGGIYRDLLATYNTSIALTAMADANDPTFRPRMDAAVQYLKDLQWTEETKPEFAGENEQNNGQQVVQGQTDPFYGGWGYGGRSRGAGRPDLSNAHMAIEALRKAGVDESDPAIQRAIEFLTRVQNFDPTNDQSWAGTDGGFVYGPSDNRQGESMAGEYTDENGKRLLRSYGSMTYAGLKSFIYAGLTKDDPRVHAAYGWITNNWTLDENPGLGASDPSKKMNGYYYYLHTLGRAMNLYDEPIVSTKNGPIDWRVALIDKCESIQQADGSFVGEKKWMESNPILVTAYVVLSLQEAREDLAEH